MSQHCRFDASRSLTAPEQDSTIIAVIEMSQAKWLVAALVPGVERQPLNKFDAHEETLLKLLHRWRSEAGEVGLNIKRIVVAFEAGRDGFWVARWLRARAVEVYVIQHCGVARTPATLGPGYGAQSSQLNAVNDAGIIAGSFTDQIGTSGVLLVPGNALGVPFQRMMIAAP